MIIKKIFIFLLVIFGVIGLFYFVHADDNQIYDDLKADSITVVPSSPAVGQVCQITVKVKNNGTRSLYTSKGISDFLYRFDNFQLTKLSYDTPSYSHMLNVGEYNNYILKGKFTKAGDSNLYFFSDNVNELTEEKLNDKGWTIKLDDNNKINKTITVVSADQVDLAVDKIVASEDPIIDNHKINITVTVKNTGKVSLTNNAMLSDTNIKADYSNFSLDSFSHNDYPSLDHPFSPGEEFNYIYTGAYVSSGKQIFKFTINKKNLVAELNKDNNASSSVFISYLNESDALNLQFLDDNIKPISSTSLQVSWQTDRKTRGKVIYKKTMFAPDLIKEDNNNTLNHKIVISGLQTNTRYYIQVVGIIGSTEKRSEVKKYTTPLSDQLQFIKSPQALINGRQAVISWSVNLLSDGSVYYHTATATTFNKADDGDNSLNHSVELSNLSPGVYYYKIISTSTPGRAINSSLASFSIAAGVSASPPSSPQSSSNQSNKTEQSSKIIIKNQSLYKRLSGHIILRVQSAGEAYYINPKSQEMYFLGRPRDAFAIMREQGIGISNANLNKIPLGLTKESGADADNDGLSNIFEDAIGTDKNKVDTDGDGYSDYDEVKKAYNPIGVGEKNFDNTFANKQIGKIFLQVESKGEAWYVNPADGKRYFLGRPQDAFTVMRELGLGISDKDFSSF